MSNSRWSSWPAGLLVGLSLQVVTIWVASIGLHADLEHYARWIVLGAAGALAGTLLAGGGALELARRLPAGRARWAQIAAAGFGVIALAMLVAFVEIYTSHRPDKLQLEYVPYIVCAGCCLAGLGLAAAARLAPLGSALVIVSMIAAPPTPILDAIGKSLQEDVGLLMATGTTVWVALALVVVGFASRDAAVPPEQNAKVVVGLRNAQTSLWIRLCSASLLSSGAGFQMMSVQKFTMVAGSIAGAVSMGLFALAMLRVASSAGPEHPRVRLNVATFLALWSAFVWAIQAIYNYQAGSVRQEPTWYLAAPLVAAVGILVLLSAIEQLARSSNDDKLLRTASTSKVLFGCITAFSMLLLAFAGGKASTGLGHLYLLIFGTSFSVCGLVLAASACGKAATAIENRPGLATATLRTPGASDPS
jgi:hypothetical protein